MLIHGIMDGAGRLLSATATPANGDERPVASSAAHGDLTREITSLFNLGAIALASGEPATAEAPLRRCLALSLTAGRARFVRLARMELVAATADLDRLDEVDLLREVVPEEPFEELSFELACGHVEAARARRGEVGAAGRARAHLAAARTKRSFSEDELAIRLLERILAD